MREEKLEQSAVKIHTRIVMAGLNRMNAQKIQGSCSSHAPCLVVNAVVDGKMVRTNNLRFSFCRIAQYNYMSHVFCHVQTDAHNDMVTGIGAN